MRALVTGGAGFIGSNLVDALLARGDDVSVVDDLSTGRRENLDGALAAGATLHEASITDGAAMTALLADERPEAVFHLAAQIDVRRAVDGPRLRRRRQRRRHRRDARGRPRRRHAPLRARLHRRRDLRRHATGCRRPRTPPPPRSRPTAPPRPPPRPTSRSTRRLHGLSTGRAALRQRLRPAAGSARRGRRDRHLLPRRREQPPGARVRRRAPDARLRLRRRRRRGASGGRRRATSPAPTTSAPGEETTVLELVERLELEPTFEPERPGEIRRSCLDRERGARGAGLARRDGARRRARSARWRPRTTKGRRSAPSPVENFCAR